MRFEKTWVILAGVVLLAYSIEAQTRRVRVRARPIQQSQLVDEEISEEDNSPQQAIQYYRAEARQDDRQTVIVDDDDYNGLYGTPAPRSRVDNFRQSGIKVTTTLAPRQKQQEARAPPVQTLRNYNKVNDDGSFTFGYEAADGSFKEETRGTDCVVRGKYGYVDPDGNKREFTYVSGNPCDPNNPDGSEEDAEKSEEDLEENVPQNYPKRPVQQRPLPVRPLQTTARAPTTVFQNTYQSYGQDDSSEEEVTIGQRARPAARPFVNQQHKEVTVTQRPQIVTTPTNVYHTPTQTIPVNITPRPAYRVTANTLQTQPPATTYRPSVFSAAPEIQVTTPRSFPSSTKASTLLGGARQPLDFEAEFKRFQTDNSVRTSSSKPVKTVSSTPKNQQQVTNNPIYQSQLVFDPATGQYNTQLYQQLPQRDGDFSLNHQIQPYVHQQQQQQQQHHIQQHQAAPQLVSLDQLQQQSPLYRQQSQPQPPQQVPQQIYQKQQNELQFINSQQLFAQQLELQQSQLRADRIEAAKKQPVQHRFQSQPQPQLQRQVIHQQQQQPQAQQYYFIQPQQSTNANGQIDAFLRGHNIEY